MTIIDNSNVWFYYIIEQILYLECNNKVFRQKKTRSWLLIKLLKLKEFWKVKSYFCCWTIKMLKYKVEKKQRCKSKLVIYLLFVYVFFYTFTVQIREHKLLCNWFLQRLAHNAKTESILIKKILKADWEFCIKKKYGLYESLSCNSLMISFLTLLI